MLSSTYGEATFSERTCREQFQCFKSGDFDVEVRCGGGKETIFEDSKLESLLAEDQCQTQEEFAESLGVTQQSSHFKTPQRHGNDSEARRLGFVQDEVERC